MSIVPQQFLNALRALSRLLQGIRGSNMMSTQQKQTNFEEILNYYFRTLNPGSAYRVPGFQIRCSCNQPQITNHASHRHHR